MKKHIATFLMSLLCLYWFICWAKRCARCNGEGWVCARCDAPMFLCNCRGNHPDGPMMSKCPDCSGRGLN